MYSTKTPATRILIWANIFCLCLMIGLTKKYFGNLSPAFLSAVGGAAPHLPVWSALTYMFLHINALHLAMNMFGLLFLGQTLERELGTKLFSALYVLCGVIAGLAIVFAGREHVVVVGASGAICGLLSTKFFLLVLQKNKTKNDKKDLKLLSIDLTIILGISFLPFVSGIAHVVGAMVGAVFAVIYYFYRKKQVMSVTAQQTITSEISATEIKV